MALDTTAWDSTEYLDSEEEIAAYLNAAFEDGDPQLVIAALGDVARARGMSQVAQHMGLSGESLSDALSPDSNPEFGTVIRLMKALNVHLRVAEASN